MIQIRQPSWVWISMATTKRTMPGHGIMGDPGLECVECANTIAARTALLVMVALIRGIWWADLWLNIRYAVCLYRVFLKTQNIHISTLGIGF